MASDKESGGIADYFRKAFKKKKKKEKKKKAKSIAEKINFGGQFD